MIVLQDNEIPVFDIYFASIIGMSIHPGTTRDAAKQMSVEEVSNLALQMIEQRRKVLRRMPPH